jgi:hypothetical protein
VPVCCAVVRVLLCDDQYEAPAELAAVATTNIARSDSKDDDMVNSTTATKPTTKTKGKDLSKVLGADSLQPKALHKSLELNKKNARRRSAGNNASTLEELTALSKHLTAHLHVKFLGTSQTRCVIEKVRDAWPHTPHCERATRAHCFCPSYRTVARERVELCSGWPWTLSEWCGVCACSPAACERRASSTSRRVA